MSRGLNDDRSRPGPSKERHSRWHGILRLRFAHTPASTSLKMTGLIYPLDCGCGINFPRQEIDREQEDPASDGIRDNPCYRQTGARPGEDSESGKQHASDGLILNDWSKSFDVARKYEEQPAIEHAERRHGSCQIFCYGF